MSKNKKKFRMVHNSFWSDPKIVEEFTPEDKLVFLYLMTNSLSTQIGIYPITRKHIAYETGYSQESIKSIMDRFINSHKIIKYDEETRELFIINWGKHNYRSGGTPMYDLVRSELSGIKNKEFIKEASDIVESEAIKSIFNEFLNDESCNESCNESGYEKENKKENENEKKDIVERNSTLHHQVIEYLCKVTGKKFNPTSAANKRMINGRVTDGYKFEDFKRVIDVKVSEWKDDPNMSKYLRPATLFNASKFEAYLNEEPNSKVINESHPTDEEDVLEKLRKQFGG